MNIQNNVIINMFVRDNKNIQLILTINAIIPIMKPFLSKSIPIVVIGIYNQIGIYIKFRKKAC